MLLAVITSGRDTLDKGERGILDGVDRGGIEHT